MSARTLLAALAGLASLAVIARALLLPDPPAFDGLSLLALALLGAVAVVEARARGRN